MNSNKPYDQYTETEFLAIINRLFVGDYSSEEELDVLVHQIVDTSEHPNGTDILFYPEQGVENSAMGILNSIKEWRQANSKPGFKPE
ncbi:bacteriocin immunity protein [Pseudomonas sp. PD9R]|uniref:bacteriocin immunity protein n=1 Tax=Pseudomonas sp. PD9R TaxID=2853534 RepID=UPI001C48F7B6|nr:bacteriocin immunity protein [Pseudomonas sp. PD9R]MBV6827298.1 bacteriocin immunity protein [Pseudomonas sp. PD9R]